MSHLPAWCLRKLPELWSKRAPRSADDRRSGEERRRDTWRSKAFREQYRGSVLFD